MFRKVKNMFGLAKIRNVIYLFVPFLGVHFLANLRNEAPYNLLNRLFLCYLITSSKVNMQSGGDSAYDEDDEGGGGMRGPGGAQCQQM